MKPTFFVFEKACFVFSISLLVFVFPFLDVCAQGDVGFLGVVFWVRGRRHPGGARLRDPRDDGTSSGTERDGGSASGRALIAARRDRKYIIAVPFNHFCIRFLSYARVGQSHRLTFSRMYSSVHVVVSTGWRVAYWKVFIIL